MGALRTAVESRVTRRRLHPEYAAVRAGAMAREENEPDENEGDENEDDENEDDENEDEESEGGPDAASGGLGSAGTRTARPEPTPPPQKTTTAPVVTTTSTIGTEAPTSTTSTPTSTTSAPNEDPASTVTAIATTSEPTAAATPSPELTPSPILSEESSTTESSGALQSMSSHGGADPSDAAGAKTATTVVITLGSVTVVLLVFLAVFWFFWRKRQRRKHESGGKSSSGWFNFATSTSSSPSILEARTAGSTNTYTSTRTRSFPRRRGTGTSGAASNASTTSSARLQSLLIDNVASVRIPFEKVSIQGLVNRGGYGEVYRGTYHDEIVAIKTLLPATRRDIRQINAFLAEVKMMAAMEHERIVRFIGVAWDSLSNLCAVSEFMEGGDLRTLLTQFEARERRPKGFDRDKARIALHVMHALTYLHSLDPVVLHRDLKSKNILLTADLDAKITDFGVSRESSDKTMTAGVGTSLWMAPEVMMGERYDEKADMFSFGVVLSELDSHLLPYATAKETVTGRVLPDTALLQMVSLGRLRIEMSANAPQAVAELAYACVDLDPRNRPSAPEALYHLDRIFKSYGR